MFGFKTPAARLIKKLEVAPMDQRHAILSIIGYDCEKDSVKKKLADDNYEDFGLKMTNLATANEVAVICDMLKRSGVKYDDDRDDKKDPKKKYALCMSRDYLRSIFSYKDAQEIICDMLSGNITIKGIWILHFIADYYRSQKWTQIFISTGTDIATAAGVGVSVLKYLKSKDNGTDDPVVILDDAPVITIDEVPVVTC